MADSNDKKEEITLAKRMFFAGCLGLPWLWICNALYFRTQVFGPYVLIDYWPGQSPPTTLEDSQQDNDNDTDTTTGNNNNSQQQSMEQQLQTQINSQELSKWVKRSTRGAFIVMSAFVAWIIVFQVNKESFGSGWFVMDETDAEKSGW